MSDTIKAAIEASREREMVLPRLTVLKRGTVWNTIWADAGNGATTGIPGTISKLGAPQADALVAMRTMEPRFREALAVAAENLFFVKVACISHQDPHATGRLNAANLQSLVERTIARITAIVEGKP